MHAACHAMEAPHHPIARTELTCLTQAGPSAQLHKTPAVWRVAAATSAAAANQDIGQPFRQRGMKIIKGENGIGAKNTNEAM